MRQSQTAKFAAALMLVCGVAGAAAAPPKPPLPPAPSTGPAPSPKSRYGEIHRVLKFTPAKPEEIQANHKLAHGWAKQFRETVDKKLFFVETAHFLIFTTWHQRDHQALAQRCEAMYRALCRQFDIPPTRHIWAGKCPVFLFWQKAHFDAFTTTVDRIGATQAGGYNVQRSNGFTYLVLSHTENKTWFHEVLIHEATHAFLGRYLTNRPIPRWANEGLADYMASHLVKDTQAEKKHAMAVQVAIAQRVQVGHIFTRMRMHWFDYGIAQSIVRHCAATDRKGFIKFIQLIKEGRNEVQALREGMNLTHQQLLTNWAKWAVAQPRR